MVFSTSSVVMDRAGARNRTRLGEGILGRMANLYNTPKALIANKRRGSDFQKQNGCTLITVRSKPESVNNLANCAPPRTVSSVKSKFESQSAAVPPKTNFVSDVKSKFESESSVVKHVSSTKKNVPHLESESKPVNYPASATNGTTSAVLSDKFSCSPSLPSSSSRLSTTTTPTVSSSPLMPAILPSETTDTFSNKPGVSIGTAEIKPSVETTVKSIIAPVVDQDKEPLVPNASEDTELASGGISSKPLIQNDAASNNINRNTSTSGDKIVKSDKCGQSVNSVKCDHRNGPSQSKLESPTKDGNATGRTSRHRRQEEGSFVFNFSTRQGKPSYVEDDGKLRHRRAVPELNDHSYVVLNSGSGEGKHLADEMRELQHVLKRPPSICDAEFVNADVLIANRSSLASRQQGEKPITKSVSFCSQTPIIHNYPTEETEQSS